MWTGTRRSRFRPPTDDDMAQSSLDAVGAALVSLNNELDPLRAGTARRASRADVDWEERSRARRMRRVCASAQAAMETGLKALNASARPAPSQDA